MVLNLDVKDKKLLYQLDINSRQTNSEIAKKVGLSKQVVGFRIKRLIKEKLITSFYTIIDISKLGFTVHKNFLRLQNLDRNEEKKLLHFLKNNLNVVWIASCDGKFDLTFGTWAKDVSYLDKTLKELQKKFGEFIAERQIATIIHGEYFIRDYLIEKQKPSDLRKSFFGSTPTPTKIDINDWNILLELGKNSRTTAVEISSKFKLSADAVASRIKKLEKAGIIKHYNIVPNESVYPYMHYKVLLGFKSFSLEKENKLLEYCRLNPNIVYIVKSLGPWDFEIDIEVENADKFREIMMDIKSEFKDLIKDYSTLHIYQVHKYNFCPSVQVEN